MKKKAHPKAKKGPKVRVGWGQVKPYAQPHSSKKGKKGYCRKTAKKNLRNNDY